MMKVAEMKTLRILLAFVLISMFICPSLQAGVKKPAYGCDHEGQKSTPQKVQTCCDQQAIEAKEFRNADLSSVLEFVLVSDKFSDLQELPLPFSLQAGSRFWKTSGRLAVLSLLRI